MLEDQDKRVVPSAIGALVKLKAPDLDAVLLNAAQDSDFGIRLAAAQAIGELKPAAGAAALREAYRVGLAGLDVRSARRARSPR